MNVAIAPTPMPAALAAAPAAAAGAAAPVVGLAETGGERPPQDQQTEDQPDEFSAIIASVAQTVVAAVDAAGARPNVIPAAAGSTATGSTGAVVAIGDSAEGSGSTIGRSGGGIDADVLQAGRAMGHPIAAEPDGSGRPAGVAADAAPARTEPDGSGLGSIAPSAPGAVATTLDPSPGRPAGVAADAAPTVGATPGMHAPAQTAADPVAMAPSPAGTAEPVDDATVDDATVDDATVDDATVDDATVDRDTSVDGSVEAETETDADRTVFRPVASLSERSRPGVPGRTGAPPVPEHTAATRVAGDEDLDGLHRDLTSAHEGLTGRRADPSSDGGRPNPTANPPTAVPGAGGTTAYVPLTGADGLATSGLPAAAGPAEPAAVETTGSPVRSAVAPPHLGTVMGGQRLTIDASDDTLGKLTITASTDRGAVNLHLVAEEARTRSALEHQQSDLRSELESAGVPLGSLDVSDGREGPESEDGDLAGDTGAIAGTGDRPEPDESTGPTRDRIDGHLDIHL